MCKVHGATAPLMGMSPAGASKVQGILQEIARQLEAAAEAKIISIESNGLGPQAVANSIADMHNGDEIVIAAPSVRVRFSMVSTCSRCDYLSVLDSDMLVCDWSGCARGACPFLPWHITHELNWRCVSGFARGAHHRAAHRGRNGQLYARGTSEGKPPCPGGAR